MPESNSIVLRLRSTMLFPALVLRDSETTRTSMEHLRSLEKWHASLTKDPARLAKAEFVFPTAREIAHALVEGDGRRLVKAMAEETARLRNLPPHEAYLRYCDPEYLAIYLEAVDRLGVLSTAGVLGIPEDFDVEKYWSA